MRIEMKEPLPGPVMHDTFRGIEITDRARSIMDRHIDRGSAVDILNALSPLPDAYHSPELMLKKLTSNPVQKRQNGFLNGTDIPVVEYVVRNDFDPLDRSAGECSLTRRWFLHDMITTGTAKRLADKGITFKIAKGRSPRFFNQNGSTHLMVTLGAQNYDWNLLIDPSFGKIASMEDKGEYKVEDIDEFRANEDDIFFGKATKTIHGWNRLLVNGGHAPTIDSGDENPSTFPLGVSGDDSLCYAIGFESKRNKPFLSVTYPYSVRQDIFWLEDEGGQTGAMTSEPLATTIHEQITEETKALIVQLGKFRFEEI